MTERPVSVDTKTPQYTPTYTLLYFVYTHSLHHLYLLPQGPYPRTAGGVERRGPFGRPEDDYNRGGYEYDGGPRFFPNGGGPRNYHEDQRGYHGENVHFPAERRSGPPSRRVRKYIFAVNVYF